VGVSAVTEVAVPRAAAEHLGDPDHAHRTEDETDHLKNLLLVGVSPRSRATAVRFESAS
jgi:hypothetical protein